jgi:poly(hydroxyalkanoate) depolymerase family esterase
MNKCWNWFESGDQERGTGEPQLINEMTQSVIQKYSANPKLVFVAGLSAGAGMSVILGATYPDTFVAIGAASGLEYAAATDMISAFTAMRMGGPDPTQQGQLAKSAQGSAARPLGVIVTHGSADTTVAPVNGKQIVQQYITTNTLNGVTLPSSGSTTSGQVPSGRSYTVTDYVSNEKITYIRFVYVDGMPHAWPGGSHDGSYTDPTAPSASNMMAEFFFKFAGARSSD